MHFIDCLQIKMISDFQIGSILRNLGIYNIPIFQNETALDLYIVVFQTAVTDVFTKGNQDGGCWQPQ